MSRYVKFYFFPRVHVLVQDFNPRLAFSLQAALGEYDEALGNYRRAVQLAPEFSFAAANYALVCLLLSD
jgi:tetratricopeptide (TPR) repeat protein